jgi:cytochrome c556
MKRIACMAGVLAVIVAAALASGDAGAEDTPTIKALMGKLHKGANAPVGALKAELKSDSPDWAKVESNSKNLLVLSAALDKNDPPKGEASSYKALAGKYYTNAKDLDAAVQKHDAKSAQGALSKINASCKECHSAHKGQ